MGRRVLEPSPYNLLSVPCMGNGKSFSLATVFNLDAPEKTQTLRGSPSHKPRYKHGDVLDHVTIHGTW